MSVQLIIDGAHVTDVIAQIQTLARALTPVGTVAAPVVALDTPKTEAVKEIVPTTTAPKEAAPETGKPLTRKEQDAAVVEMIAAGAKDERFELLTKGRQNEIEAALAKKEEPAPAEENIDDMFGDDSAPAAPEITHQMVSELMGKVCKKPDGSAKQEEALRVRGILVDNIPDGLEIKVKNIPDDKLAAVFALVEKVGA